MTDTVSLLSLVSFAGIASACAALLLGVRDLFTRGRPDAALRRELRHLPRFRDGESLGSVAQFDVWFERTLYMSGLNMGALEGVLLVALAMLAAGGAVFVATENGLLTVLVTVFVAVMVMTVLIVVSRRRLQRFEDQFPTALDLLARAVRAGESLDQSLTLVGEATADPVGTELRRCAKQLELGLALPVCMQSFAHRLNLMDVRIFANALAVHREAGGNLPTTLERLAEVIRERHSYHRQLRSVTSAGRLSSLLISALGPILFVYLFVFQPQYGGKLVADPLGRIMLAVAVVTQLIGLVWVYRLMKADY